MFIECNCRIRSSLEIDTNSLFEEDLKEILFSRILSVEMIDKEKKNPSR